MTIQKRLNLTLTLMLALVLALASCTKNEFDITGKLDGTSSQNYRFLYYASDSKKGFVIESPVTVIDGQLNLHGITRNPTLVWVVDGQGRLANIIYVERGDKLQVSGDVTRPTHWQISGNKVEEELCQWVSKNSDNIMLDEPDGLNRAVTDYVKANPESLISGILLASMYKPLPGRENEYSALVQKLPEDVRNNPAVLCAGGLQLYVADIARPDKMTRFSLYSIEGRTDTVDAKKYPATLLYFWQKPPQGTVRAGGQSNHSFNILMLKNLREKHGDKRLHIVDINCDLDTSQWYRAARQDTVAKWTRLWEPGYGMGEVSRNLGVSTTPYMLVADSTGSIRFRGYNVSETERILQQILH